jgi:hypothetical protein
MDSLAFLLRADLELVTRECHTADGKRRRKSWGLGLLVILEDRNKLAFS